MVIAPSPSMPWTTARAPADAPFKCSRGPVRASFGSQGPKASANSARIARASDSDSASACCRGAGFRSVTPIGIVVEESGRSLRCGSSSKAYTRFPCGVMFLPGAALVTGKTTCAAHGFSCAASRSGRRAERSLIEASENSETTRDGASAYARSTDPSRRRAQVPRHLQVHPEGWIVIEEEAEPHCGVGRDGAPAADQLVDPASGNAERGRELGLCDRKRLQEARLEKFPGVRRRPSRRVQASRARFVCGFLKYRDRPSPSARLPCARGKAPSIARLETFLRSLYVPLRSEALMRVNPGR